MKKLTTLLLITIICINSYAQKLPVVQQAGLRAPAKVKIDGKADEWGDKFQAHNTVSDVSYTIANDNNALYVVVQAADVNVINTIFGYGLEFAVHKSGRKNEKDKIAVNYPVNPNQWPNTFRKTDVSGDTAQAAKRMNTNNSKITTLKNLIVSGIPGLDTVSIYNDAGIMAASQFNIKAAYTIEFAIPLKQLGLMENSGSTFSYHIIVNGYKAPKLTGQVIMIAAPGMTPGPPPSAAEVDQGLADLNARIYARNPRTDFWGEYTLAK